MNLDRFDNSGRRCARAAACHQARALAIALSAARRFQQAAGRLSRACGFAWSARRRMTVRRPCSALTTGAAARTASCVDSLPGRSVRASAAGTNGPLVYFHETRLRVTEISVTALFARSPIQAPPALSKPSIFILHPCVTSRKPVTHVTHDESKLRPIVARGKILVTRPSDSPPIHPIPHAAKPAPPQGFL